MIVLLLQKLFHQILHYSLLNPSFHRLHIALLLCTYLDHKHPLGEKMTSYDFTTLAQSSKISQTVILLTALAHLEAALNALNLELQLP